jgi:predicted MPP superfamily phosphohydrolase
MPDSLLRIVQIGDLHHGGTPTAVLDDKDKAFSRDLVEMLRPDPVEDNLREIILTVQNASCDAILAMGDIVDTGHIEYYRQGLHLLLDAIVSDPTTRGKTIVLPGNHDIHRAEALQGIRKKFEHIASAVAEMGLTSVGVDEIKTISLLNASSKATLFAFNSCIGCGERRFLPERILRRRIYFEHGG